MDISDKAMKFNLDSAQDLARTRQMTQSAEQITAGKTSGSQSLEQAEKAATDFESLLLQQMIQSMWSTVPEGGMLSGSREEELYRDMLNKQVAEHMAETQGLGIKDIIVEEMKKREDV